MNSSKAVARSLGCALAACCSLLVTAPPAGASTSSNAKDYFVSLGDSYAAGYQANAAGKDYASRTGFANEILRLAKSRGYDFTLENFGCGGATTTSLLKAKGCRYPALGAPSYPNESQAAAAERFLRQHKGNIGLITVSISGDDLLSCAHLGQTVRACVRTVNSNLKALLSALRKDAGPSVPIVGTTYPDYALGTALHNGKAGVANARNSIVVALDELNPVLKTRYTAVGGTFVDVTAATGAYIPFSQTTHLAPYGKIPVAVADACKYTYYCRFGDVHPTPSGSLLIANLVVATLPMQP